MKPGRQTREDYIARINRVQDYIETNLDKELTLDELARVANFSQFHFHRIFSAMTGETLYQFISRVRLVKAANQLSVNPKKSMTEIALDCGFSSSAVFSRSFRSMFDMSPSEWREGGGSKYRKEHRNFDQPSGNQGKDSASFHVYLEDVTSTLKWRVEMTAEKKLNAEVEVKDLDEMTVAYVRHVGPYAGDTELFMGLFGKLMQWAGPRGLVQPPATKFVTVYHDDPDIVELSKQRISCGLTVAPDTEVDGEVNKLTVPAGSYALGRFEIDASQYGDAWKAMYQGWLPESGYQPDDRPCFEIYLNDPKQHPEGKHIVDIVVPVKPL